MKAIARVSLLSLLLVVCGGDDGDSVTVNSCEDLAAVIGACGTAGTAAEFRAEICDIVLLSGPCMNAAANADCSEHPDEVDASYDDLCFPSCVDGAPAQCIANEAVTLCLEDEGEFHELALRCDALCASDGSPYVGTCATEYMGQTSQSGEDTCWCGASAAPLQSETDLSGGGAAYYPHPLGKDVLRQSALR